MEASTEMDSMSGSPMKAVKEGDMMKTSLETSIGSENGMMDKDTSVMAEKGDQMEGSTEMDGVVGLPMKANMEGDKMTSSTEAGNMSPMKATNEEDHMLASTEMDSVAGSPMNAEMEENKMKSSMEMGNISDSASMKIGSPRKATGEGDKMEPSSHSDMSSNGSIRKASRILPSKSHSLHFIPDFNRSRLDLYAIPDSSEPQQELHKDSPKIKFAKPTFRAKADLRGTNSRQNSSHARDSLRFPAPLGRSLSVARKDNFIVNSQGINFYTKEYVDTETGDVFSDIPLLAIHNPKRFRQKTLGGKSLMQVTHDLEMGADFEPVMIEQTEQDFSGYNEITGKGYSWRACLRSLMLSSHDEINALRYSRPLQLSIALLTGYEAFLLDQIVGCYDNGDRRALEYALRKGFYNRNVSRILVQQIAPRFDIIWHTSTSLRWNWFYDLYGSVPIIGFTSFPATENFVNTRDHTIASIFRRLLGKGFWWTRVLTGRESLVTDDPDAVAQNLAAEGNGFEAANRNQHGTYFGRENTNAFRRQQRLPVDESLVRTFVSSPLSTMVNNGVEHVIIQLAIHWRNMLYQQFGNFAHQRMEQLEPLDFLRFHFPTMLLVLCTLRGINTWDARVLAPIVSRLQRLKTVDNVKAVVELVDEIQRVVVIPVCAGIASRAEPLLALLDSVKEALLRLEKESERVVEIVRSVDHGLELSKTLLLNTDWKVPPSAVLVDATFNVCIGKEPKHVCPLVVRKTLSLLSPKDKRTLIELCKSGLQSSPPAQQLARRTAVLLQREIRREAMNKKLQEMSKGDQVQGFKVKHIYWVVEVGGISDVYVFVGKSGIVHYFAHRASRQVREISSFRGIEVYEYILVAESITRAQKAFMTIELEHGTRFTYNAFMEFNYLRAPLRQLLVLAQVHCNELDNARLSVLQQIKLSAQTDVTVSDMQPGSTYYYLANKQYEPFKCLKPYSRDDPDFDVIRDKRILKIPPQNLIVIGGGPTGLCTTLHCLENVLLTDGKLRLYESRDAFQQAGATFERSQIVRLDPRWISMLRYHLGTIFEDVYIPASGETDAHYGNTLPAQGFIEITIKDLENMMHVQISKMLSMDLLSHDTNSGAQYDSNANKLVKLGKALKANDFILRKFDSNGEPSDVDHTWLVTKIKHEKALTPEQLRLGNEYGVYNVMRRKILKCQLVGTNIALHEYTFQYQTMNGTVEDIRVTPAQWPSVYPPGVKEHAGCISVVVQHPKRKADGTYTTVELPYREIENEKFTMDIGQFHVVEAIGKPHNSPVHIALTTYEPYGVCCMSGLKVSLGMHNFGNSRWNEGYVDDIRSHTDQNTRVIGDFTKTVNTTVIAEKMHEFLLEDPNWRMQFEQLVKDLGFGWHLEGFWESLCGHVLAYKRTAPFRRSHLQVRFFETGDNFYLGMEMTREYDRWKSVAVGSLVSIVRSRIPEVATAAAKQERALTGSLAHNFDRLWYDATLETIRGGDVYNPGGQGKVPRLYLIDSLVDVRLGSLENLESFRVLEDLAPRYEILMRNSAGIVVRDVEGFITRMSPDTIVRRGGNLTRSPNGNTESKVSIATFPVAHYVHHNALRLSNSERGYVYAFAGDEQASPHFMRYSGLTGACINTMLFNNFLDDAIRGDGFTERFRKYAEPTNWSNGEVVQRGTTSNYGKDGFLRPGFPYKEGVRYLWAKVLEHQFSEQDMEEVLTRDWKVKFAAALVPRGMEFNEEFITSMLYHIDVAAIEVLKEKVVKDKLLSMESLHSLSAAMESDKFEPGTVVQTFLDNLDATDEVKEALTAKYVSVMQYIHAVVVQVIEYAQGAFDRNERISSQLVNQPKSVDSLVDDFAVEAQQFTNALTISATLSAASLASQLFVTQASAVLSVLSIFFAIGTITNVSRYKNRNEEYRVQFKDKRYLMILKSLYECMSDADRENIPLEQNPYFRIFEACKTKFVANVKYYDYPEPLDFLRDYETMIAHLNDPQQVKVFMSKLTKKYISDVYHVNSYLQEYLVNIYMVADELSRVETRAKDFSTVASAPSLVIFERFRLFEPRLETSLQRGPILHGYSKVRKLKHSHFGAIALFLWSNMWISKTYSSGFLGLPTTIEEAKHAASSVIKPIAIEINELYYQMKGVAHTISAATLHRELEDMNALYYSTKESYVSSFLIVAAWLSLLTSIVFAVGNIELSINPDAQWALALALAGSFSFGIITPLSAILSMYYLLRKFFHIATCHWALGKRLGQVYDSSSRRPIQHVRWVARLQGFVALLRAIASGGAAVSLPWALVARQGMTDAMLPLAIAILSVALQVLTTVLLFLIEYLVLYFLPPTLGEYVCLAFDDEIHRLKRDMSVPLNDIETIQVQERRTWEYVARAFLHRYRFDAVFAANRFGSIYHFLLGGLQHLDVSAEEKQRMARGESIEVDIFF